MGRREALESILQFVTVRLLAISDGEHFHVGVVVMPVFVDVLLHVASIDNVGSRLANGILQSARNCEGSTNAEHEA